MPTRPSPKAHTKYERALISQHNQCFYIFDFDQCCTKLNNHQTEFHLTEGKGGGERDWSLLTLCTKNGPVPQKAKCQFLFCLLLPMLSLCFFLLSLAPFTHSNLILFTPYIPGAVSEVVEISLANLYKTPA